MQRVAVEVGDAEGAGDGERGLRLSGCAEGRVQEDEVFGWFLGERGRGGQAVGVDLGGWWPGWERHFWGGGEVERDGAICMLLYRVMADRS